MLASVPVSVSAAIVSAVVLAPVPISAMAAVIPVAAAMVSAITAVPVAPMYGKYVLYDLILRVKRTYRNQTSKF